MSNPVAKPPSRAMPMAVVGVGHLGRIHCRVLAELPEAELVAVVDTDLDRAREVAALYQAQAFATVAELPKSVEACVVAAPTIHHASLGLELLESGRHVLVEKPIAATVDEARQLCELAEARNLRLMVGHSERFNPVVVALDRYQLAPRFIDSHRVSPFSFRSSDVGVVLDLMIHDIDIVLHLVKSPVKAVHAVGVPVIGKHEDLANARIVFENGAVANATASRVAMKTERIIRIFSRDAYVTLDYGKKEGRIIRRGAGLKDKSLDLAAVFEEAAKNPLLFMQQNLVEIESIAIEDVEPLKAENSAFVAAIRAGTEPVVSGRHGLLALETADKIVASLQESLAKVAEFDDK